MARSMMENRGKLNPERIFQDLETASEERAVAEQNAHLLERQGEILLAQLMDQARLDGSPVTLCKEVARCSPDWATHVKGESIAIGERSRKRAHYENMKIRFEAIRTLEATERALAR